MNGDVRFLCKSLYKMNNTDTQTGAHLKVIFSNLQDILLQWRSLMHSPHFNSFNFQVEIIKVMRRQ